MDWKAVITEPASIILSKVALYTSKAVAIFVILGIGWFIAKLVQQAVTRFLKAVQVDAIADKAGITKVLAKGEIKFTLAELIGILVYWTAMLIVFVAAINALNLTVAAQLLDQIVLYIPNVVAAIFVLTMGIFAAFIASTTINTIAANVGILQGKLLAKIADIIIIVLAAIMALEQLKIATTIINLIIPIILGALGLALALAFGLGGKDAAAKIIKETLDKINK